MIRQLPDDTAPLYPFEVLDDPAVEQYLETLNEHAPGLDLTWDRAIAIGYLAAAEVRAGRIDKHRAIGARTFDSDEFDILIAASLSMLCP